MSEAQDAAARLPYGVPACVAARDSVDEILLAWSRQDLDLDFSPVGVITRLARVRSHIDAELVAVFARHGLTAADFSVVVALRRAGEPYAMPQARLMDALGLTSGTVSVRLDRLERAGVVRRTPDPDHGRASLVQLTPAGLARFDQIAPEHLANEDRLLSALSGPQRRQLSDLLRHLLTSFESPARLDRLGLTLEPAHLARSRRAAVGLSDAAGLLVSAVDPGGPAAGSVERGDLLVALAGTATPSPVTAASIAHELPAGAVDVGIMRGDEPRTVRLDLP